jgi:hypothetical protein
MTSYPLVIPSLRFAGLLSTWAAEYDIAIEHSRAVAPKPGKNRPVILVFRSVADRSALLSVARDKIEAIRTAKCSTGGGKGRRGGVKRHPVALDNIAAQLEAEYRLLS